MFNVWDLMDEREANEEISKRLEDMDRIYKECLEIAERFEKYVYLLNGKHVSQTEHRELPR